MCWRDGVLRSAPASGGQGTPFTSSLPGPWLCPQLSLRRGLAWPVRLFLSTLPRRGSCPTAGSSREALRGVASRGKPAHPCFLGDIRRGTQTWPPRCGDHMHPLYPGHLAATCTGTGALGAASPVGSRPVEDPGGHSCLELILSTTFANEDPPGQRSMPGITQGQKWVSPRPSVRPVLRFLLLQVMRDPQVPLEVRRAHSAASGPLPGWRRGEQVSGHPAWACGRGDTP